MMGAGSTLYFNDVAGLPASFLWAKAPSTVHIDFPARASGGMVIDGVAVDPLTFATESGDCGMFYGAAMTPATIGAGFHLTYSGTEPGTTSAVTPTVLDAVIAAISTSTTTVTQTTELPPVGTFDANGLQGTGAGNGTFGSDQIGGTEGSFGGSDKAEKDDKDDKNKKDEGTGLKKQADKPTAKKLGSCS